MWQTVIVLVLLIWALVYIIRHYVAIYRSEAPTCSGCSTGCCGAAPSGRKSRCDLEEVKKTEQ